MIFKPWTKFLSRTNLILSWTKNVLSRQMDRAYDENICTVLKRSKRNKHYIQYSKSYHVETLYNSQLDYSWIALSIWCKKENITLNFCFSCLFFFARNLHGKNFLFKTHDYKVFASLFCKPLHEKFRVKIFTTYI